MEKKDLFSKIGDDILKSVVNRLIPKPKSGGRGRPKKSVPWDEQIKKAVISSKIVLPVLGVWALSDKGMITGEQATMVIHYVAANQDLITIPELYPTNPNWIVKKVLKDFGVDVSEVSVTWDEIMAVVALLVQSYVANSPQAGFPSGQEETMQEIFKHFGKREPQVARSG